MKRKPPKSPSKPSSKARVPEVLPRSGASAPGKGLTEEYEDAEFEDSSEEKEDDEPSEAEIEGESRAVARAAPEGETDLEPVEKELESYAGNDPLKRYLSEVRQHPLLNPQEEYELAVRMLRDGDINAAKRLVQANLRLVVKIAMEYRSMYTNLLDLIQEGNIGLMKAVSKFDPNKGARLGYYSSWWIRSYILKYLLDNFRLVKVGTTQAQKKLFYHLMREKERLEAQGLLAGPKLLAERLNVEKDVVEMEQRLSGRGAEMSLDTPVDPGGEGNAVSHKDLIASGEEGVDDALARVQLLNVLKDRLPAFERTLNDKERSILRERLLAEEPKTLQEVADVYKLTRERARQIEAKVIEKLRGFLGKAVS